MAGLSLISTYSSASESDEEKETDKQGYEMRNTAESSNLPLPQVISSWKGVVHHEEVVDDPLQHDGRVRSFKHERGNWASLVYVEYKPSDTLRSWMNLAKMQLPSEGNVLFDEFHVSFTRSLILKFHWIDSFVNGVKELCRNTKSFILELIDVKVYSNEDKTRTFLGIHCNGNSESLKYLTKNLDKLLVEYGLPPFYEDASYHMSFLWTLGDKEETFKQNLPSLTNSLNDLLAQHVEESYVHVSQIYCKIGNKLYKFPLK